MQVQLESNSAIKLLQNMQGSQYPVNAAFVVSPSKANVRLMFLVDGQETEVFLDLKPNGMFELLTKSPDFSGGDNA
jgi:hypothetical protein